MSKKLSDTEAMDRIHHILDGKEWDSETTSKISDVVEDSGRPVREFNPGDWD